jgi:hypothetical protein
MQQISMSMSFVYRNRMVIYSITARLVKTFHPVVERASAKSTRAITFFIRPVTAERRQRQRTLEFAAS